MECANAYDAQLLSFMGGSKVGDSAARPDQVQTNPTRARSQEKLTFAKLTFFPYILSKRTGVGYVKKITASLHVFQIR